MKKMRKLCLCLALLFAINSFAFTAVSSTNAGASTYSAVKDDYPLSEFPWD